MLPEQTGPRLEVKHVVPRDDVPDLVSWLAERIGPDPHAADPNRPLIQVESVYYDTTTRSCYRGRSPHKLPKHRLRRYDGGSEAFLEEKLRIEDRVWKRRLPLTVERADVIRTTAGTLDGFEEWFRARFRILDLQPSLWVGYDRYAFVGDGAERVTIDVDLRAATIGGDAGGFDHHPTTVPVCDQAVVEVKGPPDRASAFRVELLERLCDRRADFSKYSRGLERVGLEQPPQEESAVT